MSVSRKTLAAIHIAKKDRGLDDDTYRDFLQREAGVRSAADLDERGAQRVMLAFERLGFEKPSKPGRAAQDRRPIAKKAVALWIMLHNLDEVANASDRALDAFARRVTGKERLRFCTNGEVGKVVEALKDWCQRAGVDADTTHAQLDPLRSLVRRQCDLLLRHIYDGAEPDDEFAIDQLLARRFKLDHQVALQGFVNKGGDLIRRLKLGSRHAAPGNPGAVSPSPSTGEET